MEEKIKMFYKKQEKGKIKFVLCCIVFYFLTICIISLFLGSPFPYKEKVMFLEISGSGWIAEKGYLLIFCIISGMVLGITLTIFSIIKEFHELDKILLWKCDAKKYISLTEYGVKYGKSINLKGFQNSVFTIMQQKYVMALVANLNMDEAERYLNFCWIGNKNTILYKKLFIGFKLNKLFNEKKVEEFNYIIKTVDKKASKRKLIKGEKYLIEKDYNKAIDILIGYKEKIPYYEVLRQYTLGKCFYGTGDEKNAEIYMKYTFEMGNTMPCKYYAQNYLNKIYNI